MRPDKPLLHRLSGIVRPYGDKTMLPFAPDEVRTLHDESTESLERKAKELRADGDYLWAKGSKQAANRCHDQARSIEGLVASRRRRG